MGKQSNFYAASKNYAFVSVTGGGGSHHLYKTKVTIGGIVTTFAVTVATKNKNAYNQLVQEIKRNEFKIKQLKGK